MKYRSHLLRCYRQDPELYPHMQQFLNYLMTVETMKFEITGLNPLTGKLEEKQIDYFTRYHPIYQKSVIARFYKLTEVWKDEPITMITLTTGQDGSWAHKHGRPVTIGEAFVILKEGWVKVRKLLNKWGYLHYVYVYEPHTNGYPHIHVIVRGIIPSESEAVLKRLWASEYKIGSETHGLDFKVIDDLESTRNYLLKYIFPSLSIDGSYHSEHEGQLTYEHLKYLVYQWLGNHRAWGSSRSVTHLMKRSEIVDPELDGLSDTKSPLAVQWDNGRSLSWSRVVDVLCGLTGQEWIETTRNIHRITRS